MEAFEIGCRRCGSEDFELLDAKTGEMLCKYCRNRWIEPALIQKTDTEKFLAEQAKQPKVVIDNTTETDKQIMDMFSKVAGVATSGCVNRVLRVAVVVIAAVIILVVLGFCGLPFLLR